MSENRKDTTVQRIIPRSVGRRMAMHIHLILPVSFFIVRHVVEHGQWNRANIAMQR